MKLVKLYEEVSENDEVELNDVLQELRKLENYKSVSQKIGGSIGELEDIFTKVMDEHFPKVTQEDRNEMFMEVFGKIIKPFTY